MKTIRCTDCHTEFSEEETQGITACPSCKTTGLPHYISQDTEIKINWHELRILTIWATNHASTLDVGCRKTLQSIIKRLEAQRKEDWPALTIFGEIKELPAKLAEHGIECGRIEYYEGNKRVIPPMPRLVYEDDGEPD